MKSKKQLIYPRLLLNFNDNRMKEVESEILFSFHVGEQFQYNGAVYDITNIKHHFKEGFAPYTEIMLSENEEEKEYKAFLAKEKK